MEWWRPDLVLPALGAAVAGGLIGYEREFGGRAAGVRTHALLALGCALLMLMAFHATEWRGLSVPGSSLRIEPLRMVQAVLTGIGFLGGGVIFREGFSVHGLTTAASVWMSATIGLLFGSGFYELAVGGAIGALVVLAGLHGIDRRLPHEEVTDISIRFRRGEEPPAEDLGRLATEHGGRVTHVSWRLDSGDGVEWTAVLKSRRLLDVEALKSRLCGDARVIAFSIDPRND